MDGVAKSRCRAPRSRLAAALLPALLLAAAAPAQAPASTAAVEGATLTYTADPGESNHLTIEPVADDRSYRLSDDAAIRPDSGCRSAGDGREVICAGAAVALVRVDVGDRDDYVEGPPAFLVESLRVELRGGEGDDVLLSGIYADNLQEGGPGNDTLAAGDSAYVLRGGDGDDRLLTGVDGAGTFDGGGGDDYLEPQGNRESISGGAGLDTLSYRLACCYPAGPAKVTLDGLANDGHNGPTGNDDNVASDIEVITGSPSDDSLTGDAGANFLHGADGADTLAGGAGDDYLYGETGDDRLTGGAGNDQLDGGRGDDALDSRDGGPDSVVCGPGDDSVIADSSDSLAGDCERRDVAPAPAAEASAVAAPAAAASATASGGVAGAVASAPRVSIARRATLRRGVLTLALRCRSSARRLTGSVSVSARIERRSRSLGRARFRCRGGGSAVASIRLRADQRRLLAGAKRVRLSLRMATRDSDGGSARTISTATLADR